MKKYLLLPGTFILLCFTSCNTKTENKAADKQVATPSTQATDPLPSWNDGDLKQSIIAFVKEVTDSTGQHFVPVEDRIATFDNDGTLWAEVPFVQELFAFERVKEMVKAKPELANQQPFKAVITKDKAFFAKGGEKALLDLVAATHTGMTEEQFETEAKAFFAAAIYPERNVPIKQITYQPQLELLSYLRANGFKTFICSGGTIELIRAISADYYGISKEQVIGTSFKYKFLDSSRSILREPALDLLTDKAGKPVGIQLHIGKRPVFSAGNVRSGGDIEMLEFCQSNKYPSFQLMVNHDDSTREYFYQEKDSASLKASALNKWHVVSMKNDWKTIFRNK